jgi:hypothetical protein
VSARDRAAEALQGDGTCRIREPVREREIRFDVKSHGGGVP